MIAPEAGLSIAGNARCSGLRAAASITGRGRNLPRNSSFQSGSTGFFTDCPVYGSRRLQVALLREGISVGRRRVRRLMKKLGLWAVRPKRNTSKRHPEHKVYPYLLRKL
jgi:hypothetical protein